jgi:hypothetical protein
MYAPNDIPVILSYLTNTWGKAFNPTRQSSPRTHQVDELCTLPIGEATDGRQHLAAELALPEFNQAALARLEAMGFPQICCQKALLATGNSDPEVVMEWLFARMEDPGKSFTHLLICAARPLLL